MSDTLQVRNNVLDEETYTKTIKEGTHGSFKLRALFPKQQRLIAGIIAGPGFQNGMSVDAFTTEDQYRFSRDATLEVAVVEGPEWWSGPDDCPDEDLLNRIFKEIISFSRDIQEKLKKNKLVKRGAKTGAPD